MESQKETMELITKADLSLVEQRLLIYLEDCTVNKSGRIDYKKINSAEQQILQRWRSLGWIGHGRIVEEKVSIQGAHWCTISDNLAAIAGEIRRDYATMRWKNLKPYRAEFQD